MQKWGERMATEPAILHFTKLSSHQTPSGGLREAIRFDVLCSGESFAHFLMAFTSKTTSVANFGYFFCNIILVKLTHSLKTKIFRE